MQASFQRFLGTLSSLITRSISFEPEGTAGNLSSSAAKTHLLVAELGPIVSVSKHQLFESFQEGKG